MKKQSSVFLFAFGAMIVACTAAPAGGVPGGDPQDDSDDTIPTQQSNQTSASSSKQSSATPSQGSTPSDSTPAPAPGDADGGATPVPTPAPGADTCGGTADADACFDCCDQANPGGFDVDWQAFDTCACEAPGVCASVCGNNYCAGGDPSAACEQCLDNATQCEDAAEAACQANAACQGAIACIEASKCDDKPF